MMRQSNRRKRGAFLRASVTILKTRRQGRVADQAQVMVVFICQEGKGAKADKARNLVILIDQMMKGVKMGLFGEKGFTLSSQASHHIRDPTQRNALSNQMASFASHRALHGLELLVSPLDNEISIAHGNEEHLHPYRRSPDNDNE